MSHLATRFLATAFALGLFTCLPARADITVAPAASTVGTAQQVAGAGRPGSAAGTELGGVPSDIDRSKGTGRGVLEDRLLVWKNNDPQEKSYCLPPKTAFSTSQSTAKDSHEVYIKVLDANVIDCNDNKTPISQTTYYIADFVDLQGASNSEEWVIGAVSIPFKYYVGGDGSFVGNTTVGGYAGEQFHYQGGVNATYAIILGPAFISVPANGNQAGAVSGSTASANAVTFGFGVFVSMGDGSGGQFGIAVGEDTVGRGVQWNNNGHVWIAAQIGYKFL